MTLGTKRLEVAPDLVELLPAVAHEFEGAADVADSLSTDNVTASRNVGYGTYDNLYRLKAAYGPTGSWAWSYDANGNRTGETHNSTLSSYTVNSANDWLSSIATGSATESFGYTSYGNLLSDVTAGTNTAYGYNHNDRLSSVTVNGATKAGYLYDGFARRVAKVLPAGMNTINYGYDPMGHELNEFVASGVSPTVTSENIWLGDQKLAAVVNGSVYTTAVDHLGTTRRMYNASQATVWDANYAPFGAATVTNGTVTSNQRFPGQYYDSESGLHQNWHRNYSPALGRYVESDPIGLQGGVNPYSYVGDRPTGELDMAGLCAQDDCKDAPRAPVIAWICRLLATHNFDPKAAAKDAYDVRTAENGRNDTAVYREGENWLTAAAWSGWGDPQGYVPLIYLWQYLKYLPTATEQFSTDALNAGLDGHRHAKRSKEDLKKWCHDCSK